MSSMHKSGKGQWLRILKNIIKEGGEKKSVFQSSQVAVKQLLLSMTVTAAQRTADMQLPGSEGQNSCVSVSKFLK